VSRNRRGNLSGRGKRLAGPRRSPGGVRVYARSSEGILIAVSRIAPRLALLLLLSTGLLDCGGPPPPVSPESSTPGEVASGAFSAERAWSDLEALTALGPRSLGSPGAEEARRYIVSALEQDGIDVETVTTTVDSEDLGTLTLTHVVARLPGTSTDRLVLIAPYDSGQYDDFTFIGANDGASGAALLLEIARALAARERHYTVEFVWLQGEGRLGRGSETEREERWLGSRSLAAQWAEEGQLAPIRLLADFNRVCDADLRVARDLGSHRVHRNEFWTAARRLGYADAFPVDRGYESVTASHVAFREQGVRPVVAIEDTVFGGDEAPGLYAANEGDVLAHCSPESLAAVGEVTVEAVDAIAARLAKIDRFAKTPSAEPEAADLGEDTSRSPAGGEEPAAGTGSDEADPA
jgi:Peptidase family M28